MDKNNSPIWRTPSEILELHPKIANIYDAQRIGYLAYGGAVTSKKKSRGCLIDERDFLHFLEWRYGIKDV